MAVFRHRVSIACRFVNPAAAVDHFIRTDWMVQAVIGWALGSCVPRTWVYRGREGERVRCAGIMASASGRRGRTAGRAVGAEVHRRRTSFQSGAGRVPGPGVAVGWAVRDDRGRGRA